MAPTWSPLRPIISFTPALAVTLTRPPKEWQRRMHMAQPLPYLLQFAGPPAVPVASMKTSLQPSRDSSPCLAKTARMAPSAISTSVTRIWHWMETPLETRKFRTMGSMRATL